MLRTPLRQTTALTTQLSTPISRGRALNCRIIHQLASETAKHDESNRMFGDLREEKRT